MILFGLLLLTGFIFGVSLKNYQTMPIRVIMSLMAVFVLNGIYAMLAHLLSLALTNTVYLLFVLASVLCLFLFNKLQKNLAPLPCTSSLKTGLGEIISLAMLFVGGLAVFYFQNRFGADITYLSVDPAGHFDMSRTFGENRKLIIDQQSELLDYSKYPYPILFYVNAGLWLNVVGGLSIAKTVQMFNIFNWLVYMLCALEIYCVLRIINLKIIEISIAIFVVIMLGFPLNVLVTGFSSQLFAMVFCLALIITILCEEGVNASNKWVHLILQNFCLAGVALSYHYFLPEMMLGLIVFHWIKLGLEMTIGNLFLLARQMIKKYYLSVLIVSPMLVNMMGGLPVIKADGVITRDLFSSFVPFLPGLVMVVHIKRKDDSNIMNAMLMASLLFSCVLYVMCYFKLASPYYFYKNYVWIYMLMGLNTAVCIQSGVLNNIGTRLSLNFMIILGCAGIFYNPHSEVLAADNNFILSVNKREIGYLRYSADQMNLISEFSRINANQESTCVVDANPGNLIWFWELTHGIHYRGPLRAKYPWNSQAWDELNLDAQCKLPNYKYVFDYKCTRSDGLLVKESAGSCIYDTGIQPQS